MKKFNSTLLFTHVEKGIVDYDYIHTRELNEDNALTDHLTKSVGASKQARNAFSSLSQHHYLESKEDRTPQKENRA